MSYMYTYMYNVYVYVYVYVLYMYMYMYTYTHRYTYLYRYLYTCMCISQRPDDASSLGSTSSETLSALQNIRSLRNCFQEVVVYRISLSSRLSRFTGVLRTYVRDAARMQLPSSFSSSSYSLESVNRSAARMQPFCSYPLLFLLLFLLLLFYVCPRSAACMHMKTNNK